MSSSSSSSERSTSDAEYPDHVHECLKYVPIYKKGAFSCTSAEDDEDDEDDEDVKRILAEHDEPEPEDRETAQFSPAYERAAAAAAAAAENESPPAHVTADGENYEDWDDALDDVRNVYPALGVGRAVSGVPVGRAVSGIPVGPDEPADPTAERRVDYGGNGDRLGSGSPAARELRKCLEGALYGRDAEDFVVAQPYRVADKNLDFGKPRMSQKAANDSRKKVENWMRKHCARDDGEGRAAAAFYR